MKTSARNTYRGTVSQVVDGVVNSEVTLDIGGGLHIYATITRHSVADLGLKPGVAAVALIKSSFVILAPAAEVGRTSARNALKGVISSVDNGPVSSEVTLTLAGGQPLVAVITKDSVQALAFKVGDAVVALIKAPHVILAVD